MNTIDKKKLVKEIKENKDACKKQMSIAKKLSKKTDLELNLLIGMQIKSISKKLKAKNINSATRYCFEYVNKLCGELVERLTKMIVENDRRQKLAINDLLKELKGIEVLLEVLNISESNVVAKKAGVSSLMSEMARQYESKKQFEKELVEIAENYMKDKNNKFFEAELLNKKNDLKIVNTKIELISKVLKDRVFVEYVSELEDVKKANEDNLVDVIAAQGKKEALEFEIEMETSINADASDDAILEALSLAKAIKNENTAVAKEPSDTSEALAKLEA